MRNSDESVPRAPKHAPLLATLEQLLAIEATERKPALDQASQLIAKVLDAAKVDVFLYDPAVDSLVAGGTSDTPMGRQQHAHGLERLPVANGGRAVHTYLHSGPFMTGRSDEDPEELVGVKNTLGVRSSLLVPLAIEGERRGVLSVVSDLPDHFDEADLHFLEAAARWIAMIVHRVELVEQIRRATAEQARRRTADELISILAHDLRTPLTPLFGWTDMIRTTAVREGREREARAAEAMLRGLERLRRMTTDLLDASRLEHGVFALDLKVVDLVAVVHQAIGIVGIPEEQIAMRVPATLEVVVDPGRIQQVLENLLSNARRYSPAGTPVELALQSDRSRDPGVAVITVHDRGPGIDAMLMPRLFTRFGAGPGSKGLGLGLYLSRGIVEAHGGTLTAASHPGEGATFRVDLPLLGPIAG